jgi:poly[(R)-3-hydroxyalkanoate] polymerase subunit PhaC
MTSTTDTDRQLAHGPRAATQAALDVMLTEAAVEPGAAARLVRPGTAARLAGSLARRPQRVARRVGGLGTELARVATGASQLAPPRGDRRFTDRAWQESWMFHRLMQSYLALDATVDELVDDAQLDWRADTQSRFMLDNLLDAIAPTNFPLTNPQVLKETIDRGGSNLVRGGRRLVRDVSKGRLPAMVDTSKFQLGSNLAVSEGAVVMHTDVFELIQYRPTTAEVYETPLLIVPPTINKFYILDLAPGRSIVEYLVAQGHQVFVMSWRNPDREHAFFDFDTYAQSVLEARDTVAEIASQDSVNMMAACSGGIITAGALGHLAEEGKLGDVGSVTLMVSALDNAQAGTTGALATREIAAAAVAESARRGYLDGEALASVFAWLRPNDLIWNYVINNYLLGKEPPAFDILYWNQDTVRLAAGLHRDFVMMALENAFATPGGMRVLGTDVDLGKVDLDAYIVAGSNDHIVQWMNAYRSTQLLGGDSRFVLSTSGHIQALINPPTGWAGAESRSSYRIADDNPPEVPDWETAAVTHRGSWWPDYVAWLEPRAGKLVPAPKRLGSRMHKAMAKAPGTYVMAA